MPDVQNFLYAFTKLASIINHNSFNVAGFAANGEVPDADPDEVMRKLRAL